MPALAEKTIVVTRPREQAVELKFELEKLGANVVLFPTIEIVPPENYFDLDAAIQNLSKYDWLILTSANAAEHFLRRLEANRLETADLDLLRICAVGEATFERLRLSQVHVDLVPTESNAEGIFAALCDYLGDVNEFKELRFLLPRSNIGRDFLLQKLSAGGATVDAVTAYKNVLPEKPEIGKLKALLQSGAIDCVTFTSPSTFKNFLQMLSENDLLSLLTGVALACLGKTTANAVLENNLQIAIVASDASARAFAEAIADFYR